MSERPTITRLHFVQKFMQAGLTYDQACRAFSSITAVLEEALVNGNKVKFAGIGCLFPVRKAPRNVVMGFVRGPGGSLTRSKRVFRLDGRIDYRFNFYREFSRRHQLR